MIKKFFLIVFIFLSFLTNFSYSQTNTSPNTSGNIDYEYVSPFDGGSGSKTIANTSTRDVGYVFNYLLTGMAVVIVILVIYRLLQGAVIKGTIENFYSQMKGRKYIQTAGIALIVFIFAYAILSFINPDLTGWTVATSYITKVRDNISEATGNNASSNKCVVNSSYNSKTIEDEIKYDEQRGQFSSNVYLDQVGLPTIGWGFNLKQDNSANIMKQAGLSSDKATALANCSGPNKGCPSITQNEADAIFNISLNSAKANAVSFAGGAGNFNSLPQNVQKVLINMSYNMGSLTSFKDSGDTKQGLTKKDWNQMAYGIQDSIYCGQVQDRCARIVGLLLGMCPTPQTSGSLAGGALKVSGDSVTLAKKILDLETQGNITFGFPAAEKSVQETAKGSVVGTDCNSMPTRVTTINPQILAFLVALGTNNKIQINTLTNGCHSPNSNHYDGNAVDLQCTLNGKDLTGLTTPPADMDAVANVNGIKRYTGENCTTSAGHHWHYSTTGT